MLERQLSRRDIVKLVGASILAGAGFGAESYHITDNQTDFPEIKYLDDPTSLESNIIWVHESRFDTNVDPIFRGANITLTDGEHPYARAGIIDIDSNIYLQTAQHVAEVTTRAQDPIIHIPGMGILPLDIGRFMFAHKNDREVETQAFYIVPSQVQDEIRQAAGNGIIAPLVYERSLPQSGEPVAITNRTTGDYEIFTYETYFSRDNMFKLSGTSYGMCAGDSGSVVLTIDDEYIPTGKSYGTVLGVSEAVYYEDQKPCSATIYAKPN